MGVVWLCFGMQFPFLASARGCRARCPSYGDGYLVTGGSRVKGVYTTMVREAMVAPSARFKDASIRGEVDIVQVGVDFRTTPVETLQRCRLGPDQETLLLSGLVDESAVEEAVLLSTCNRKEFYAACRNPRAAEALLLERLESLFPSPGGILAPGVRRGRDTVHHLIAVTAGLESALLGEQEIAGQVRRALEVARKAGSIGHTTERLFQHATGSARVVRNELGLGGKRRSLTDMAAAWVRSNLKTRERRIAAVVGTGEMSRQMASRVKELGFRRVVVFGRRREKTEQVSREFARFGTELAELPRLARESDLIVCATSAPEPILGSEDLLPAASARKDQILVVDLGIPRNTEAELADLPNVHLLDMASIVGLAAENSGERSEWKFRVKELLERETDEFLEWQRTRSMADSLRDLRIHYETTIREEALRACRRHGQEDRVEHAQRFAGRLSGKLLHPFFLGLKEIAAEESPRRAEELVQCLVLRDPDADRPSNCGPQEDA